MGISQSTPDSDNYQQYSHLRDLDNIPGHPNLVVFDETQILGEQYKRKIPNSQKDQQYQIFKRRQYHNHKNIVKILQLQTSKDCMTCIQQQNNFTIITEHISYRLKDFQDINYSEAIMILKQALAGYNQIANQYQLSYPNPQTIWITEKSQIKVWLHQNLSINAIDVHRKPYNQQTFLKQLVLVLGDLIVAEQKDRFLSEMKSIVPLSFMTVQQYLVDRYGREIQSGRFLLQQRIYKKNTLSPLSRGEISPVFVQNRQIRSYSEGGKRIPLAPNKPRTVVNIPKTYDTEVRVAYNTKQSNQTNYSLPRSNNQSIPLQKVPKKQYRFQNINRYTQTPQPKYHHPPFRTNNSNIINFKYSQVPMTTTNQTISNQARHPIRFFSEQKPKSTINPNPKQNQQEQSNRGRIGQVSPIIDFRDLNIKMKQKTHYTEKRMKVEPVFQNIQSHKFSMVIPQHMSKKINFSYTAARLPSKRPVLTNAISEISQKPSIQPFQLGLQLEDLIAKQNNRSTESATCRKEAPEKIQRPKQLRSERTTDYGQDFRLSQKISQQYIHEIDQHEIKSNTFESPLSKVNTDLNQSASNSKQAAQEFKFYLRSAEIENEQGIGSPRENQMGYENCIIERWDEQQSFSHKS